MTAPTTSPTDLTPGWLRRTWVSHLADPRFPGRTDKADQRGYLLESDVPELLEPFVDLDSGYAREPAAPIHWVSDIGATVAARLLDALPSSVLEQDWSTFAPSPETLLRVVAAQDGAMTCGGDVASPLIPAEGLRLWSLKLWDDSALPVEPDVVPAALGSWLDELPRAGYAEYLRDRQACLDHGRTRPAWAAVAGRYGIHDSRRHPLTETITDPTTGATGLWFRW